MLKIIKLLIWIFIISIIVFYVNYNNFKNQTLRNNITISIKPGDNIVSALVRELNFSEFYLKVYLKLNPEKSIKPKVGEYRLLNGENIDKIIKTIDYGPISIDKKLIILEGWNIFDIDEYLTNQNIIKKGDYINEVKNVKKYINKYDFLDENIISLEGFLYPDTYFINPNKFSLEDFINKQLKNFELKVYNNYLKNKTKKEILKIINISSIVEREAFFKGGMEEKKIISGILLKRYKEKWMIGADITACYAFELTSNECKMNLSKYINLKNDYNTRTMVGLPKTPINNPSLDTILSVLDPINTDYYYYLHDKNGKIHYAKTLEEHNKNKKLYLR